MDSPLQRSGPFAKVYLSIYLSLPLSLAGWLAGFGSCDLKRKGEEIKAPPPSLPSATELRKREGERERQKEKIKSHKTWHRVPSTQQPT